MENKESLLRKQMLQIHNDSELSPEEKAHQMQVYIKLITN